MFKTRFTELTGVKYPIMQGGMMWISTPEFVAAVSNAGCLGTLTALSAASPEELSVNINKVRQFTSNPFAVNITLLPTLRPINYDSYIDVIIGEGIKTVETAARNPEEFTGKLKAAGITIIHKCTSLRHAVKAQELGCDIISIDGYECAGHPGEDDVTSLVILPIVANNLKIPVIGSGGFADGRGLVAALALGAAGINMGTRFMMTEEAPMHRNVKNWLRQATERDTMILLRSFSNSSRVVRNSVSEKAAELEKKGAAIEELAPLIKGKRGLAMMESGNINEGVMSAGQAIGLINDIPTIKQMVDRMISEAGQVISRRLNPLLSN